MSDNVVTPGDKTRRIIHNIQQSAALAIPAVPARRAGLHASGAHRRRVADCPVCCRCNRFTAVSARQGAAPAAPLFHVQVTTLVYTLEF